MAMTGYWGPQGAQEALEMVFPQILGRPIDIPGLESFGRHLVLEGWTMRDVVLALAKSDEYYQRYVAPYIPMQDWGAIIRPMYMRFLGRPPENESVVAGHARAMTDPQNGWKKIVDSLIGSQEYLSRWGEQGIPGYGQHPFPAKRTP